MNEFSTVNRDVRLEVDVAGVSRLEGVLLTIVEASASDPTQRKAVKDLIRTSVYTK